MRKADLRVWYVRRTRFGLDNPKLHVRGRASRTVKSGNAGADGKSDVRRESWIMDDNP